MILLFFYYPLNIIKEGFQIKYTEILKTIKPSDEHRAGIIKFTDNIKQIIEDYAGERGVLMKCRLVGSVAKRTSLVNKADIDIFMPFSLDYAGDELKEYGLEFGMHCIEVLGGDYQLRYASHPYVTGFIDGYEIDFVPCYDIRDSSQLKSAVDRTILHTDYVQTHMSDKQADQVLLLKKFMSSVNTYGANYKVSGFSGYLCELLILKYGSFENTLENAIKWHYNFKIDLEDYGTCDNFKDPLVFIDPVDKNRNVAAALSLQKFSEFIVAAGNYLRNPSDNYFRRREINTTKDCLIDSFRRRETGCYVLSFNVPDLPTDVIYPQINKTTKSLDRVSRMYDFDILKSDYYIEDNRAFIILEYQNDTLSRVKLHKGPEVEDNINGMNFKNKYPDAYILGDRWVNLSERKYKTVEEMISDILKSGNMNILRIGKNIREEILKNYTFIPVEEFIENSNSRCIENLFLYLNVNYNIER